MEYTWVVQKQAEFANTKDVTFFVVDEEEEDDDEDDDEELNSRKKSRKKSRKSSQEKTFPILRDVVDPLRKALSTALPMWFHGTAETGINPV